MLSNLPVELLGHIRQFLLRHEISRLAATCKYIYYASLPYLYYHLELGYHAHIRQLHNGISSTQPILRKSILEHTRILTLRSRQNGNNWRIQNLISILSTSNKIEELIFYDFSRLSTQLIQQITSILPNLKHIQFKYCHIVNHDNQAVNNTSFYSMKKPLNNENNTPTGQDQFKSNTDNRLQHVSYLWTDFTEKSITASCSLFSQITKLELGSNRNKYDFINGHMVRSLHENCPKITHLTINLPQVDHKDLSHTITQYEKQLLHLSIQCDHIEILEAVAVHATQLQSLIIRHNNTAFSPPIGEENNFALACIIDNCQSLDHFEIISHHIEKLVPDMIWEACMAYGDSELYHQAQEAISKNRKNQDQSTSQNSSSSSSSSRNPPTTRGSVWFSTVSEEVLMQRHLYMSRVGLRQKKNDEVVSSNTNLTLDKQLLTAIRRPVKKLKEGCYGDDNKSNGALKS